MSDVGGGSLMPDAARFAKRTLRKRKDPEEGRPEQLTLPRRAGLTVSPESGEAVGDVFGRRGDATQTTLVDDSTQTAGEQAAKADSPRRDTDG